MPTYIESSNCRGLRPTGIVGARHNMRPEIVGRLIKDRHVARYVVAPRGYGRSSLAFEYAQLVFEFKNVFWLRCSSPCFLRDLDGGTMLEDIERSDPDFKLVVFDDVPMMDPDRASMFNDIVESLLGTDREVIAITTPSADSFSSFQLDKIFVKGEDLLLSAEEIELERLRGNVDGASRSPYPKSMSAPSQVWGSSDSSAIVAGIASEELPEEMRCAAFSILAVGCGTLSELQPLFDEGSSGDVLDYLAANYPILGIEEGAPAFSAAEVPVDDLAKWFQWGKRGIGVAKCGSIATLVGFLAQLLISKGLHSRALKLAYACLGREDCASWLAKNGYALLAKGSVFDTWSIANMCKRSMGASPWELTLLDALGKWALGNGNAAKGACISEIHSDRADPCHRIAVMSLLAIIESLEGNAPSAALLSDMRGALKDMGKLHGNPPHRPDEGSSGGWLDWRLVAEIICESDADAQGIASSAARVCELADAMASRMRADEQSIADAGIGSLCAPDADALLMCIVWMSATLKNPDAMAGIAREETARILARAACKLVDHGAPEASPLLRGIASAAMVDCMDALGIELRDSERALLLEEAHECERARNSERSRYVAFEESRQAEREDYSITHTASQSSLTFKRSEQERARSTVPTLHIELFGGFSAKTKDDEFQMKRITRAKSKKALAMLALCKGSEISKERMGKLLWPEADFEAATRNFYVVWSNLKKSLSVNGRCPYLVKSHVGYKLDMRHVSIDIDGFDDLCRRLLFGKDDMSEWEALYEKASGKYSAEILPEFATDADFDDMRRRCSMQLVDGLVAASMRMLEASENRGAVWFAREALSHDDLREDAYKALIMAYIATEQRASALDAYFQCRNRLRDELGIDPSPSIVALYRSIIETEEHM